MSVEEYGERRPLYVQLAIRLEKLLTSIMTAEQIEGTIESRAKTLASYSEKMTREGKQYSDPLNEITDLCGVRIIVRTLHDVERMGELIRQELQVDEKNSIQKGQDFDPDRFGYRSDHLIVELSHSRKNLVEWREFSGLKAELQLRTIGQHAWASVEHALAYKTADDVPKELRRRLFRLSALFELADQEIEEISLASAKLSQNYKQELSAANPSEQNIGVELNIDSLRAYVETSEIVSVYARHIRSLGANIDLPMYSMTLSRNIQMAKMAGIESINKIDDLLKSSLPWGFDYIDEALTNTFGPEITDKHSVVADGIVSFFLIANFGRVFSDPVLNELGWGNSQNFTQPAKRHNPNYPEPTTSQAIHLV